MRYANPVVAKTSWSWALRVLSSVSEGEGDERGERSTIGREENEVVICGKTVEWCKINNSSS